MTDPDRSRFLRAAGEGNALSAPILVNASPATQQLWAALRQVILLASGGASALGFTHLGADLGVAAAMIAAFVAVATVIYGQIYTRRAEKKQLAMAQVLPDEIAQVKT